LETRKIAMEAGQVPPELEQFLKDNGFNMPQSYINTAGDTELENMRESVRRRFYSGKDPEFNAEVERQGGIEEYLNKNFGKTWYGRQRRPSADLMNDTGNFWVEQQYNQENPNGGQSDEQGNKPPKEARNKGRNQWGKWGNLLKTTGQHAYMNSYGKNSNNDTYPLQAFNTNIEIKVDGRNVDDEKLAALIGDKVVGALGTIADNNRA
jgi:hypothetical protein